MSRFSLLLALTLTGCQTLSGTRPSAPMDVHSHARPDEVRAKHVSLDLDLDFERKSVAGTAALDFERLEASAPLVLDAHRLEIRGVHGDDGTPRDFELSEHDPVLGSALTIELEPGDARVVVDYRTSGNTEALQWLGPEQTSGDAPFLFTQGQSILTRSWIPLQDSPGVRITYDARVRAPEGLVVVMSAEQLGRHDDGTYRFRLDKPIPPYLIALGAGDLAFAPLSDRAGVWAEPQVLEAAAHEFADTEAMIRTAEKLFGAYRWGRYDLLVLPPAFPFGGMENPLLTFLTPTVIAGDRSLVGLIAHELAHSWSGNLVTNATWRDFWLNEGFTVYLEQRIMEEVYGLERSNMEKALDYDDLVAELAKQEPWEQVLHVDLDGKHPDDGFSNVPYQKGALFLRRLEQVFGRERFDEFLLGYFDDHAFQSLTTAQFHEYLERELLSTSELSAQVDVDRWLYEPGLPETAVRASSDGIAAVEAQLERLARGTSAAELQTAGWVTQQWLHFLENLPEDLDEGRLRDLDLTFGLTSTGNNEILCAWLVRCVRSDYDAAYDRLEQFLMTVGRRKFLSPLYEALAETPAGFDRARAIYARARGRYHAVSSGSIDRILDWRPAPTSS